MAPETLWVVPDRGYFKSEETLACHDASITTYVPKRMNSGAKAGGRFNYDAFIYDTVKTNTFARLEKRSFGAIPT